MTRIDGEWLRHPGTQQVLTVLAGGGHRALVVGGCVRNALIGAPVADVDIATDATPDRVCDLAKAAGLRVIPTGLDHGTVTVIAGDRPYEVTTFRRDVETDGRHAVVQFSDDLGTDARRRDFTMNALYADAAGRVYDPLGGLADLVARKVRFIDNPADRIAEDHLRTLRFFRFHAWYGDPEGGLDAEGLAACAALAEGIEQLSKERIGAEMVKLLAAPDPAPAVAAMAQSGILARVLPGAETRMLALLVHVEQRSATAPDSLRRLASLGGAEPDDRLRLSRQQAVRLTRLRDLMGATTPLAEIAFRDGSDIAQDTALLRATLSESPVSESDRQAIAAGTNARFPVSARDLMPDLQGRALGERLAELERHWIDSGFSLSREDLLG